MALPPACKEVLVAAVLADVAPAGMLAMTCGRSGRLGCLVVLRERLARAPAPAWPRRHSLPAAAAARAPKAASAAGRGRRPASSGGRGRGRRPASAAPGRHAAASAAAASRPPRAASAGGSRRRASVSPAAAPGRRAATDAAAASQALTAASWSPSPSPPLADSTPAVSSPTAGGADEGAPAVSSGQRSRGAGASPAASGADEAAPAVSSGWKSRGAGASPAAGSDDEAAPAPAPSLDPGAAGSRGGAGELGCAAPRPGSAAPSPRAAPSAGGPVSRPGSAAQSPRAAPGAGGPAPKGEPGAAARPPARREGRRDREDREDGDDREDGGEREGGAGAAAALDLAELLAQRDRLRRRYGARMHAFRGFAELDEAAAAYFPAGLGRDLFCALARAFAAGASAGELAGQLGAAPGAVGACLEGEAAGSGVFRRIGARWHLAPSVGQPGAGSEAVWPGLRVALRTYRSGLPLKARHAAAPLAQRPLRLVSTLSSVMAHRHRRTSGARADARIIFYHTLYPNPTLPCPVLTVPSARARALTAPLPTRRARAEGGARALRRSWCGRPTGSRRTASWRCRPPGRRCWWRASWQTCRRRARSP